MIDRLKELLAKDKLTYDEKVEGTDILIGFGNQLEAKEVYVPEPEDIDDEVTMVWTEAQLDKLREAAVVAIANGMGIDATVRDKKSDTIEKILDFQNQ